jgi:hypothetical protein
MNGKLILGVVLMIVGLAVAVGGIVRGGGRDVRETPPTQAVGPSQAQDSPGSSSSIAWPLVAGLSIAIGGALVGIGMGRFKRPMVVRPHSPQATKAVTSTGVVHDEKGTDRRSRTG